ncbi:MAG: aspartate dehydrogenase [Acidobacteria bacterium]|nr:aspartate dehydrogenase [Acidobacteriota bacterium]
MRIALIGAGSIGEFLLRAVARGEAGNVQVMGIADVPSAGARLQELASRTGCAFTTEPLELLKFHPELVVESASQGCVRQYAVKLLEGDVDLLLMSIGALGDAQLLDSILRTAATRGRRVHVPSGAIGGLDALQAAALDEIEEVTIISSKPPQALAGAPFFRDHPVDLEAIHQKTVLFKGSAREGVRWFPANVNVAAAVSLSGVGFDRTRMAVVADPALDRNVHEVFARGKFGELRLQLKNVPSSENPKTSHLACLSSVCLLRKLSSPLQIG